MGQNPQRSPATRYQYPWCLRSFPGLARTIFCPMATVSIHHLYPPNPKPVHSALCLALLPSPLDETLIQAALTPLLGEHHLAAFQRTGSKRSHAWVNVQAAECSRRGSFIHIEIQANGFLYGMVRLLVGMLVDIGQGKLSLAQFQDIWKNEKRHLVKYSAPAKGLCLLRVGYPEPLFPPHIWFDTQPTFLLTH